MAEQTPARVLEVRGKFYELLGNCIPPTVILNVYHSKRGLPVRRINVSHFHYSQAVAERLVDQMDVALEAGVMHWAAFYERRMRIGNKKIFHLEAWVINVTCLHKVSSVAPLLEVIPFDGPGPTTG